MPESAAEQARAIEGRDDLDKLRERLHRYPNVTGSAVGFPRVDGEYQRDRACLVAYVSEKVPEGDLRESEVIPDSIGGVDVDVRVMDVTDAAGEHEQNSPQQESRFRPLVGGLQGGRDGEIGSFAFGVHDASGNPRMLTVEHTITSGSDCGNAEADVTGNAVYQYQLDSGETDNNKVGNVTDGSGADGSDYDWALFDYDDASWHTNQVVGLGAITQEYGGTVSVGDRLVVGGGRSGLVGAEVVGTSATVNNSGCTYNGLLDAVLDERPDTNGNSGCAIFHVASDGTATAVGVYAFHDGADPPDNNLFQPIGDIQTASGFQYDTGSYSISGDGSAAYFQAACASVDDANRTMDVVAANAGGSQGTVTVNVRAGMGGEVVDSHTATLGPMQGEVFTASLDDNYEIYTLETPDMEWVVDTKIGFTNQGADPWSLAQTLTDGTGFCFDSDFSPDGSLAAKAQGGDGNVYVYDTSDWSMSQTLSDRDSGDRSYSCRFSNDGSMLAGGGQTGNSQGVYVYDTSDWSLVTSISANVGGSTAYDLAWSSDDSWLAVAWSGDGSTGGAVVIYDTSDWSVVQSIDDGFADFAKHSVDFSHDDSMLVMGKTDAAEINVFDTSDWSQAFGLTGDTQAGRGVDFAPNDRMMASGDDNDGTSGDLMIAREEDWVGTTGVTPYATFGLGPDVHGVRFGPNGQYVAAGSEDHDLYVYQYTDYDDSWAEIPASPFADPTDQSGGYPQGLSWDGTNGYLANPSYDSNLYVYNAPVTVSTTSAQSASMQPAAAQAGAPAVSASDGASQAQMSPAVAQALATTPSVDELYWDSVDVDSPASSSGMVHENTADTDHTNASVLKQGYSAAGPEPRPSDLIAYYPMHEDSGTTCHDLSGNANDGTVNGATPGGASMVLETTGYSFDGTDDWVDLPAAFNNEVAVSMWIRTTQTFDPATFDDAILLGLDPAGEFLRVAIRDDHLFMNCVGDANTGEGSVVLNDGSLHHIFAQYDGTTVQAWVDMTLDFDLTRSWNSFTGAAGDIGSKNGSAQFYQGDVQEMRIYDISSSGLFSASEVQQLYDVVDTPGTLITAGKQT